MQEGRFREDLYHRLNVVPLRVPSLAERRDDIPALINYFVAQLANSSGLAPRRIGEDAIAVLQAHDWPGNVRELRNNIERLMILSGGEPDAIITANMLPEEIGSNVPLPVNGGAEHLMSLPLREAREIFEREYCWRRSTASAATSRARRNSWAWSARRCTASCARSASPPRRSVVPATRRRKTRTDLQPRYPQNAHPTSRTSMARVVYVNGHYHDYAQAGVHAEDRGFQFGDAVYEVMEVKAGHLVDETRHMARLVRSLERTRIAHRCRWAAWSRVLRETIRRNRCATVSSTCRCRVAPGRGILFPRSKRCADGCRAGASRRESQGRCASGEGDRRHHTPDIRWGRCDIKTVMLLPASMAKEKAKAQDAKEAWFVDDKGFVTEGGSSNAWIIDRNGRLVTRATDASILPGITRMAVLDLLKREGLELDIRPFTVEESEGGAGSIHHVRDQSRDASRPH